MAPDASSGKEARMTGEGGALVETVVMAAGWVGLGGLAVAFCVLLIRYFFSIAKIFRWTGATDQKVESFERSRESVEGDLVLQRETGEARAREDRDRLANLLESMETRHKEDRERLEKQRREDRERLEKQCREDLERWENQRREDEARRREDLAALEKRLEGMENQRREDEARRREDLAALEKRLEGMEVGHREDMKEVREKIGNLESGLGARLTGVEIEVARMAEKFDGHLAIHGVSMSNSPRQLSELGGKVSGTASADQWARAEAAELADAAAGREDYEINGEYLE